MCYLNKNTSVRSLSSPPLFLSKNLVCLQLGGLVPPLDCPIRPILAPFLNLEFKINLQVHTLLLFGGNNFVDKNKFLPLN